MPPFGIMVRRACDTGCAAAAAGPRGQARRRDAGRRGVDAREGGPGTLREDVLLGYVDPPARLVVASLDSRQYASRLVSG